MSKKTKKIKKQVVEKKVCVECKGKGDVMWKHGEHEMKHFCPICKGVGYFEETKEVEVEVEVEEEKVEKKEEPINQ